MNHVTFSDIASKPVRYKIYAHLAVRYLTHARTDNKMLKKAFHEFVIVSTANGWYVNNPWMT